MVRGAAPRTADRAGACDWSRRRIRSGVTRGPGLLYFRAEQFHPTRAHPHLATAGGIGDEETLAPRSGVFQHQPVNFPVKQ